MIMFVASLQYESIFLVINILSSCIITFHISPISSQPVTVMSSMCKVVGVKTIFSELCHASQAEERD